MRKLSMFNNVSLDGCFTDAHSDMSWAHNNDPEWSAYVSDNAGGNGALLFGRVTYQQMASFWPTAQAKQMMPDVAAGMNSMPKYVFSKTLASADWQNTTLLEGDIVASVQKLKAESGPPIVILGSGTIVTQLTQAGLIDEYQLVVCPVVLGGGRSLFEGGTLKQLRLQSSRAFKNGNVVLRYELA